MLFCHSFTTARGKAEMDHLLERQKLVAAASVKILSKVTAAAAVDSVYVWIMQCMVCRFAEL